MAKTAIILDCGTLRSSDAADVDRIARLQLGLRRRGFELRLRHPTSSLQELIGFCGLAGVLRIEPGRKAEEWEQPCRVEEEGQLGDPPLGQLEDLQGPRFVATGRAGFVLTESGRAIRADGRNDP